MNTKVSNAVDRLNSILPLAESQRSLSNELVDVYQNILRSYVERGRTLSRDEIAQQVGDVDESVRLLREKDMVVFDGDDEPVGAYPFTMEPREHEVTVNGNKVHCMCALDALAVSPMFGMDTSIQSICRASRQPVSIHQHGREIVDGGDNRDVFFGISWNAASSSCCATSLCTEMIFLKGAQTAGQWQAEDADNREIFDLQDAVDFAAGFFTPLIAERAR